MRDIYTVDHTVEAPYLHSTGAGLSRFFTALRDEGVILGRRCTGCKKVVVPANDYCEQCSASLDEFVPVGPDGVVVGSTWVATPPALSRIDTPFAYVRIRLDGADTDFVHIAREDLAVGSRTRAVFAVERTGTIRDISHFAPASSLPATLSLAAASGAPPEPVTAVRTNLSLPFRLAAGALQTRFHEAIKQGELYGTRCEVCRQLYVPPREVCAKCWARCHGWERVSDHGKLNTFVVVNVPFYGQEITIPYILGHIQLEGADTIFFHLVGEKNAEGKLVMPTQGVKMGANVKAVWRPAAERTGLFNDDIDYFKLEQA